MFLYDQYYLFVLDFCTQLIQSAKFGSPLQLVKEDYQILYTNSEDTTQNAQGPIGALFIMFLISFLIWHVSELLYYTCEYTRKLM